MVNGHDRWYERVIMKYIRRSASPFWTRRLLLIAVSILLIALRANAQQAPERYRCSFRETKTDEILALEFVYDRVRDKALMIGNNGV